MAIERRYRERKPYRVGIGTHVFLLSCVALVVTFFAWSAIGKLEEVSAATGEVVPSSQLKTVQHLEGGIVRQILVREGDKVKQGQALVEALRQRHGQRGFGFAGVFLEPAIQSFTDQIFDNRPHFG